MALVGQTCLALAAGLAVGALFDDVGVGRGPDRGLVGRLAGHQAGLVLAGEVHRADLGAFVAVDAETDVDVAGPVVYLDRKVAGQALGAHHGAVGHDLDVGVLAVVEQEGRDRGPRAAVAVVRGAAAEDTVVGGEHEAQLGHDPADAGRRIQQVDLVPRVGQVHGGAHAAHASAHDHHRTTHFPLNHYVPPQVLAVL